MKTIYGFNAISRKIPAVSLNLEIGKPAPQFYMEDADPRTDHPTEDKTLQDIHSQIARLLGTV